MNHLARVALIVAGAAQGGCSIASGTFVFDELEYPASMSSFVGGPDGSSVNKRDLRTVGTLEYEKSFWSIAYGLIAFTGDSEAGDELNQQIRDKGGDGVVNLTASAEPCRINNFFFMNWWPIWPACVTGKLSGEIVKYTPPAAPEAPKSAPPAPPPAPAVAPAPAAPAPSAPATPAPALAPESFRLVPREQLVATASELWTARLREFGRTRGEP